MQYKWNDTNFSKERTENYDNKVITENQPINSSPFEYAKKCLFSNSLIYIEEGCNLIQSFAENEELDFFSPEIIQRFGFLRKNNLISIQFSSIILLLSKYNSKFLQKIFLKEEIIFLISLLSQPILIEEKLKIIRTFTNIISQSQRLTVDIINNNLPQLSLSIARDSIQQLEALESDPSKLQYINTRDLMKEIIFLFVSYFDQEELFLTHSKTVLDLSASLIFACHKFNDEILLRAMLTAIDYAGQNSKKTAIHLFVKDEIISFLYEYIGLQVQKENLRTPSFTIVLEILLNFSLFDSTAKKMCELGFFALPIELPSISDFDLGIFIQILSHFADESPEIAFAILQTRWIDMLKDVYEKMTASLKENMIRLISTLADYHDDIILHKLIEVFPNIIDWLTEQLFGTNKIIMSLCLKAFNSIADYTIGQVGQGIPTKPFGPIIESLNNNDIITAVQNIIDDEELNPIAIENSLAILKNLSPQSLKRDEPSFIVNRKCIYYRINQ